MEANSITRHCLVSSAVPKISHKKAPTCVFSSFVILLMVISERKLNLIERDGREKRGGGFHGVRPPPSKRIRCGDKETRRRRSEERGFMPYPCRCCCSLGARSPCSPRARVSGPSSMEKKQTEDSSAAAAAAAWLWSPVAQLD